MTLPLHPEMLAAAYDYLRTTPPFSRWKLPTSSEVKFRVVKDPTVRGWYNTRNGKHIIAISSGCVGFTSNLIETMAHEMVHLHQRSANLETRDVQHNAAFKKLSERVCRFHGFDPKLF